MDHQEEVEQLQVGHGEQGEQHVVELEALVVDSQEDDEQQVGGAEQGEELEALVVVEVVELEALVVDHQEDDERAR